MKKFMVRVTESINHDYAIEAETQEDAIDAYHRLTDTQIKELDLDGSGEWDAYPWEVYEMEDSETNWKLIKKEETDS